MYIGLILVGVVVVIAGLVYAFCGVMWALVNVFRRLKSIFYTNTPFVPYSFDDLFRDLHVGESSTSSYSSSSSSPSSRPTSMFHNHPLLSNREGMDPEHAERLELMLPYLHMTNQVDEYMEGGWAKVDLNRNPWKDYPD